MFSTGETAEALGVSAKRLDNIITGAARTLIDVGTNGRSRTITQNVVERLAVALLLERDLGVSIRQGIALASQLVASPDGSITVGSLGSLQFDVDRLRSVLRNALGDAVDGQDRPRRGRPTIPTKKKRGAL